LSGDRVFTDDKIQIAQNTLCGKIDSEQRRVNLYDPNSPLIDDAIKSVMANALKRLLQSFDELRMSDVSSSSHRWRIRSAMEAKQFQDELMQIPAIHDYAGPQDEVMVTLMGNVTRVAMDLANTLQVPTAVSTHYVKELIGADKLEVQQRHRKVGATMSLP
jgi:hypothetical protein